jgi:hypothetical protein
MLLLPLLLVTFSMCAWHGEGLTATHERAAQQQQQQQQQTKTVSRQEAATLQLPCTRLSAIKWLLVEQPHQRLSAIKWLLVEQPHQRLSAIK